MQSKHNMTQGTGKHKDNTLNIQETNTTYQAYAGQHLQSTHHSSPFLSLQFTNLAGDFSSDSFFTPERFRGKGGPHNGARSRSNRQCFLPLRRALALGLRAPPKALVLICMYIYGCMRAVMCMFQCTIIHTCSHTCSHTYSHTYRHTVIQ